MQQISIAQSNNANVFTIEGSLNPEIRVYHTIKEFSITDNKLAHFICVDILHFTLRAWQGPQSGKYNTVIYDDNYIVHPITVYGCEVFAVDAFDKFKNKVTIELMYNGSPVSGAKIEGVKINELIQPLDNKVYDGEIIEINSDWLKAKGCGWSDGIAKEMKK